MDVLTPVVVGALLALFTGIQTWITKGRFDEIDRRFDQVDKRFDQVDKRFEQVDKRFEQVDKRIEQLAADVAALRSDLLHVALSSRPHPQTG